TDEDIEHRVATFQAGSLILVSAWHGNRDGIEPDAFDITAERPRARVLTFGAGIHYCVGANLARDEMQEGLAFLAEHVAGVELDGGAGGIEYGTPSGIYGLETLPVRFTMA